MGVEFLILTIYFICVIYVIYQMALSVEAKREDQFEIEFDGETLQAAIATQLAQQTLYDVETEVLSQGKALLKMTFLHQQQPVGVVAVQMGPVGKQPLERPFNNIRVSIANTLPDQQVCINWDHSAISVYGGPAQRVIRQVPGRPTDLLQPQVYTVVNPQLQTNVAVTSENMLSRPADQMALEIGSSLIDMKQIPKFKEQQRQYSLRLLMWVRSMAYPDSPAMQLLLPFTFQIKVLPDHVALPVLSWLLDFNPFAPNS